MNFDLYQTPSKMLSAIIPPKISDLEKISEKSCRSAKSDEGSTFTRNAPARPGRGARQKIDLRGGAS
jgi:hypothetical protein